MRQPVARGFSTSRLPSSRFPRWLLTESFRPERWEAFPSLGGSCAGQHRNLSRSLGGLWWDGRRQETRAWVGELVCPCCEPAVITGYTCYEAHPHLCATGCTNLKWKLTGTPERSPSALRQETNRFAQQGRDDGGG